MPLFGDQYTRVTAYLNGESIGEIDLTVNREDNNTEETAEEELERIFDDLISTNAISEESSSNSDNFYLSELTTVPVVDTFPEPILNSRTATISGVASGILSTNSSIDRLTDYIEDYLRSRDAEAENKFFINHHSCQREIEFNDINDVIEFRNYLDSVIKNHFTTNQS